MNGGPNGRSPLTATGPTTFGSAKAYGFTLTAFGCYRSGTRVLCDFDLTKVPAAQMGVQPFAELAMVSDGGRILRRVDSYYMAPEGAHMAIAYLSESAVRYVMEYEDCRRTPRR